MKALFDILDKYYKDKYSLIYLYMFLTVYYNYKKNTR